jgi:hypothetical protein
MARPISLKGQIRKVQRAYRNKDFGDLIWNLVGLLIKDIEEDPSKIRNSGINDIITLSRIIKDLEETKAKTREQEEDNAFSERLKELTKNAS